MSPSDLEKVSLQPAESVTDFLFTRQLRNEVRLSMTGNTAPVSYLQQLRFYLNRPPQIQIYIARRGKRRVGYLLLRERGDTHLITEAVHVAFRGQRIASAMVRFAQQRFHDLTAEILIGNKASIALHEATGFEFEGHDGRVVIYRFRKYDSVGH